ncbi:recombinase family protein, partial [Streptococcus pneumoniae]
MKKNNVEIIKADSLVRRRGDNVERHLKRVAAYCRVSSDSEDQKNSYDSQVRHYKEYISQRSDWELADIYADEGISGTQVGKRQDFQRLINDCANGEIDYIVTKAIARFARNTLDTLKYVRMLKDMQIGVYFEEENIDTLTMDGELLLTILSSVAQQEVENTSAHVKKGLKMKMQRGELVGFQGCLGYDYDVETKQISINKKEAKIVRYIFERYLEGIGGKVIARELDELGYKSPRGLEHWNDTTVLGIIKNEKYKGDILMGKTFTVDPISKRRLSNFGEEDKYYIKDNHEPIISKEDFEKAQEIRLRRAGNKKTAANVNGKRERYSKMYAFSSMLECGFCGSILSRRSWHCRSDYRKVVWHCVTSIKKGKKFCKHSKGLEEIAIEGAFLEAYRQVYHSNENLMTDLLETIESELNDNSLNKELKRITNKLRILDLFGNCKKCYTIFMETVYDKAQKL